MKTLITLLILLSITITLAACNTVEGAGKDTKAAGQSMENAANNNR